MLLTGTGKGVGFMKVVPINVRAIREVAMARIFRFKLFTAMVIEWFVMVFQK
jgi:hypothetical protein